MKLTDKIKRFLFGLPAPKNEKVDLVEHAPRSNDRLLEFVKEFCKRFTGKLETKYSRSFNLIKAVFCLRDRKQGIEITIFFEKFSWKKDIEKTLAVTDENLRKSLKDYFLFSGDNWDASLDYIDSKYGLTKLFNEYLATIDMNKELEKKLITESENRYVGS